MRRFPFLFIVLEGLDFVGKTICAKLLAQMMGGVYYKFPPSPYREVKGYVDTCPDLQYRLKFYLESNLYASNEIEKLLQSGPVVSDRYVYTTIAYHEAFGADVSQIDIIKLGILLPDFSFLLAASEEVYLKRSGGRKEKSIIDEVMEKKPGLRRKVYENYQRFPMTEIDTSALTVKEVCEKIMAIVSAD